MTPQTVLPAELRKKYELLRRLLEDGLALAEKCGEDQAAKFLKDRLAQLQSAALFVIVGEIKAGKSSFINALLGEDICDVAPDPCTASIQELVFGEERKKVTLGERWEQIHLPKPVLRDITIVDTPGTNSIIRDHQTITENYIPRSDLVIFVFPAKNPHTASAWELLSFISAQWHRKTVFVLQQADLASAHELEINLDRVKQYARERNVQNPVVFAVSAKKEFEGAQDSGFAEFRQFLQNVVESGEVWKMKVEGSCDMVQKIADDLVARLSHEGQAIGEDKVFYRDLLEKVESRRRKAESLRRLVVDSLGVSYDRLTSRLERNFREGLGIGVILRRAIPFLRDKDVKTWIADLQQKFQKQAKEEMDDQSKRASKDLSEEMKAMLDDLSTAIEHRKKRHSQAERLVVSERSDILDRLSSQLQDLRIADIVGEKGLQGSDLGMMTLTGGGIAALGAVIALSSHLIAFDITGGILAAVGAGLIAVTLLWKRSDIMNDFSKQLAKSREEFRGRLEQEISQMFERLFLEIAHDLKEPLSRLDDELKRIDALASEAKAVSEAAGLLK